MKTYILNIPQRLKEASESLDVKAYLCNKSWLVYNDEGVKQLFIFIPDGKLYITLNGAVTTSSWIYIPANKSIIISSADKSIMFHPVYTDENIIAFQQDGTMQNLILLNENENIPNSLDEIQNRILSKTKNEALPTSLSLNQEVHEPLSGIKTEDTITYSSVYLYDLKSHNKKIIEGLLLCKSKIVCESWYEYKGTKSAIIKDELDDTIFECVVVGQIGVYKVDISTLLKLVTIKKWADCTSGEHSYSKEIIPHIQAMFSNYDIKNFPEHGDLYIWRESCKKMWYIISLTANTGASYYEVDRLDYKRIDIIMGLRSEVRFRRKAFINF